MKALICVTCLSLNFFIYHLIFIVKLKNYGKNIHKHKKPPTVTVLCYEIGKLLAITFIALAVSSLCCIFDGLSSKRLLAIPFVAAFALGFAEWILYTVYFSSIGKKNQIAGGSFTYQNGIGGLSLFLGVMHAVICGQFIYTLILF